MGGMISQLMYTGEKLVACCTVTMLVTCLIMTLVTILALGIGIGYNYCFVDIKTKHRYVPSGHRRPTGKRVPQYTGYPYGPGNYPGYPGHGYPPGYPGYDYYPGPHRPGYPGRPYPEHEWPPGPGYPGYPGPGYPGPGYPGYPGPGYPGPGYPGYPYPDHGYPGPGYPGYNPRAKEDVNTTLPTTELVTPLLNVSSAVNFTMKALFKTIAENATKMQPTRTTNNSTVESTTVTGISDKVMMFIRSTDKRINNSIRLYTVGTLTPRLIKRETGIIES